MSGFREALGRHLLAIEEKDIDALSDTVAPDGVLLVMSDGSGGRWLMVQDQNTPIK